MKRARLIQLWYVPWLGTAMLLMLGRTLVIARLLDVQGFGEFSSALLVSNSFCMLGALGLYPLLQRDLPLLIVRETERRGILLLMQGMIVAVVCAALLALLPLLAVRIAGLTAPAALLAIAHGLAQQLFLIATTESRSRGQPLRFALQNLVRAALMFAAGAAVAVATHSMKTVLVVETLVSLVMVHLTLRKILRDVGTRARIALLAAIRSLRTARWRSAVTLLFAGFAAFLMLNADRWVGAQALPAAGFAHYAFPWTVLLVAQSCQALVNASFYTMAARRYATLGRAAAYQTSLRVSGALFVTGALAALPATWLLERAIPTWFPAYADTTTLIPAMIAIAVLRVSDVWSGFLAMVGLEARLLALNVAAILVATAIWFAVVRPLGTPLRLSDLVWLAALMTLVNYVLTAVAAWRASRVS